MQRFAMHSCGKEHHPTVADLNERSRSAFQGGNRSTRPPVSALSFVLCLTLTPRCMRKRPPITPPISSD